MGVLGATGAVGREIINCLETRGFPYSEIRALASERSAGQELDYGITVAAVTLESFQGLDLAIFAAGGGVSREYAPIAARSGCPVVDNSSFWRLDPRVPLVVPEVNPRALHGHRGIIANPNCSTIQMLVALKPIYDAVGIKRIVVSTYQAVSGTGHKAIEELADQTRRLFNLQEAPLKVYPHRIAFNCLPQVDDFIDNGYTKEEMKMLNETRKVFGDDRIRVSATCVRVPVFHAHSEAVWIETGRPIEPAAARELMRRAPGILVVDEPGRYPMPIDAAGRDEVFVGRVRADLSSENGLTMWIVADNLRKGAATNAVEIAELLIRDPELLKTSWEW